jgi:hypothetical protein
MATINPFLNAQEEQKSQFQSSIEVGKESYRIIIERIDFKKGKVLYDSPLLIRAIVEPPEKEEKISSLHEGSEYQQDQIEFKISLILAKKSKNRGKLNVDEFQEIIRKLETLFQYNTYVQLDSFDLKFGESSTVVASNRGGPVHGFRLEIQKPKVYLAKEQTIVDSALKLTKAEKTFIETELSLKNGETTVVGASRMEGGEKGIIIILSAKLSDKEKTK